MLAGNSKATKEEKPGDQLSQSAESAFATRRNGTRSREVDDLVQEVASLRNRLSKLSEASRRVSENLDVNTVLQEVIDNARNLTNARYGALLTYKQSGGIQDFITSGLSPHEMKLLNSSPQGLGLLGYMNEIREPLRLADISSHPSSVGFPDNHPPMKTFIGMSIHHRGQHVGNIYLTEKERGREFTSEDQDILVMFASQAGAAVYNARRYQEEQHARADLEALVNISPVGVLVFDAKTGNLVSANDETRRIVGRLNTSGRSLDQLLETIGLKRADGSEIPIDELPTTRAAKTGKDVLADEVVIHLPDGRAITTLVNARPIRQDDGDVVSVVVTMQDITFMEEMKRQRTEFLGNLSHELRTPLTAIKGSTSTMLSFPHQLDRVETRQFLRVIDEQVDRMRLLLTDLFDMTQLETGTLSVEPVPTDLGGLLVEASEAYSPEHGRDDSVEVYVAPTLPLVMADRRRITQVIGKLLATASRHSPASSAISIRAHPKDLFVSVSVGSEGGDADSPHELGRHSGTTDGLVRSRRERDDLDLAICKGIVEAHGGRLYVVRGERPGSKFTFTIPVAQRAEQIAEQGLVNPRSAHHPEVRKARVLFVGDDPQTARHIRSILTEAGFSVVLTCGPDGANRFIETQKPNLVLVEPPSPWDDGLELLQHIDGISDAPTIFVAGHEWDQQMGRAFKVGVTDYIAKPFAATELIARINVALLRERVDSGKESRPYRHGDLVIDYVERRVTVAGRSIDLTVTEYKLLAELSNAAGRVLTHEQLLRRVWGTLYSSDVRVVRTFIKELRFKLGDDAAHPDYIFTEFGVGYRMPRPSRS